MADDNGQEAMQEEWTSFVSQMNEQLMETVEASTQAQSDMMRTWFGAGDSLDDEAISEGIDGYSQAYDVWMNAAQDSAEKVMEAVQSGEVAPNELRDVWLEAANEAFKEVMSTEAFAAATGQSIEDALEMQQQINENMQDTLHQLGFSTEGDVREIGERLAELEHRQKKVESRLRGTDGVEEKLDRILDHLEDDE